MTFDEIRKILDRITYKPGWVLYLDSKGSGSIKAKSSPTINVKDSQHTIEIVAGAAIDPYWKSEEDVILAVGKLLRSLENHEFDEWFKFDGVCIEDPHPEIAIYNEQVQHK